MGEMFKNIYIYLFTYCLHVHMHAWYEHRSVHMHMEARGQFDGVSFLGPRDQTRLSGLVQAPSPSEPPLWLSGRILQSPL